MSARGGETSFVRWLDSIHRAGLCQIVVAVFRGDRRVEVECATCTPNEVTP